MRIFFLLCLSGLSLRRTPLHFTRGLYAKGTEKELQTGTQCAVINCHQSVAQAGEEKPFSVRALTFSCALSDVLSIRSLSQSRTLPINQSVRPRRIVWPVECNTHEGMRWDVV